VGVPRDFPNFYSTPIISGMRKATKFKFGRYIHSIDANKRLFKNLGEKGALAYPGTSQILKVRPIISERVKLRTSNLASIFRGSLRTNAR